eukprot:gene22283-26882_t
MEHDGSEKDLPRERQRTLCIGDEVLLSLYLPESRMAGYLEATSDFKSVVAEGLPENYLGFTDWIGTCIDNALARLSVDLQRKSVKGKAGRSGSRDWHLGRIWSQDQDELLELVQSQSTTGGAVGTGRGMSDKRRAFREKGMVMEELVANLLELKRLEGAEVLFGDTIQCAPPSESIPPESVPLESIPPESVPPEIIPPESVPLESVPPESIPLEIPLESILPESVPPEIIPPEISPESIPPES